jgi:hypothetical protein
MLNDRTKCKRTKQCVLFSQLLKQMEYFKVKFSFEDHKFATLGRKVLDCIDSLNKHHEHSIEWICVLYKYSINQSEISFRLKKKLQQTFKKKNYMLSTFHNACVTCRNCAECLFCLFFKP